MNPAFVGSANSRIFGINAVDQTWVRRHLSRASHPKYETTSQYAPERSSAMLKGFLVSRQSGSNRRPADYKSAALPAELCRRLRDKAQRLPAIPRHLNRIFGCAQSTPSPTMRLDRIADRKLRRQPPLRAVFSVALV